MKPLPSEESENLFLHDQWVTSEIAVLGETHPKGSWINQIQTQHISFFILKKTFHFAISVLVFIVCSKIFVIGISHNVFFTKRCPAQPLGHGGPFYLAGISIG